MDGHTSLNAPISEAKQGQARLVLGWEKEAILEVDGAASSSSSLPYKLPPFAALATTQWTSPPSVPTAVMFCLGCL